MPVIALGDKGRLLGKLKQLDLVAQMVGQLRHQILAGKFGLDGQLPTESELGETFGVSRTVAREAMRTLRTQGLVEVSRGRKSRVRRVDPHVAVESLEALLIQSVASIHDAHELRRTLELEIAAVAAERATPKCVQTMQRAIDTNKDGDLRFHLLLADATGNALYPVLLASLVTLLHENRKPAGHPRRNSLSIEAHQAILSAVRNRDAAEARLAMAEHLNIVEGQAP